MSKIRYSIVLTCLLIVVIFSEISLALSITIDGPFSSKLNLEVPVKRIISLSPATTEVLFAIGAGDKIVGATIFDDYPEEAKAIPKVGDLLNPSIEKILQFNPDLVIGIANLHEKLLKRIMDLGIPCYAFKLYDSLDELYESIEILGRFTGKEKESKELIEKIRKEFIDLFQEGRKLKRHPTVFLVIWDSPLVTVSRKSYINDLIEIAGGKNIVSETKAYFPIYSIEKLIEESPDIILVAGGEGNMGVSKERVLRVLSKRGIRAVDSGNVFEVDGNLIFRLSPRVIEGAKLFHEVFKRWAEGG